MPLSQHWTKILGNRTEDRFFAIFAQYQTSGKLPRGLLSVRRATIQQDQNGIDAVVVTDQGEFSLQIKSSAKGRRNHKEATKRNQRVKIPCIVVDPALPDKRIFSRLEVIYWRWCEQQPQQSKTASA